MDNQTENRSSGKTVNPWQQRLETQGIDFNIGKRWTDVISDDISKPLTIDELSGVPIETDNLRNLLVQNLKECLAKEKKWTCIYRDVDNLNQANRKYSRQFGDMVIRYGVSNTAQLLDRLDLNSKAEVYLHREKIAADETVVWIFDIDDEEIERLREEVKRSDESIAVNLDEKKMFNFSITSSVIDQGDRQHQQLIKKTIDWLKEEATEPPRLPFLLYQTIKEQGDTNVKISKIEKDPERLFYNEFLLKDGNIRALIKLLTSQFGDSRISSQLLELICQLTSISAVTSFIGQNPQAQEAHLSLLKELGVDEKRLSTIRTSSDIGVIYQDLFGKEEAEISS